MTGCCANATPFGAEADGCVGMVSCVAAPAVTVMVDDVIAVRPDAVKVSVRGRAGTGLEWSRDATTYPAFEVAVGVPPSLPLPAATDAATTTPVSLHIALPISCN